MKRILLIALLISLTWNIIPLVGGQEKAVFETVDAGQQTTSSNQNDIWEKIKHRMESGDTEIYLHNLIVEHPPEEEPIYRAQVMGIKAVVE